VHDPVKEIIENKVSFIKLHLFFRFLFHFFQNSAIFATKSFYDASVAFRIYPIHYLDDDPLRGYLIFFFPNYKGNSQRPIRRNHTYDFHKQKHFQTTQSPFAL